MTDSNSNETRKNIWSDVTLDELIDAIASLGDHVKQLKHETWRLNDKTSLSSSLWHQVINKCKNLKHDTQTRVSLYKIWLNNRRKIKDLVEEEQRARNRNQNHNNNNDIPATEINNRNLLSDASLPLPERPNTRANQDKKADDNDNPSSVVEEICISFTPIEWKSVFSRTHQKSKVAYKDFVGKNVSVFFIEQEESNF